MYVMSFNPYTGRRRHPLDIRSDPMGVLMVDPEVRLLAATGRRDPVRQALGVPPIARATVTFLYNPFTGEERSMEEVVRDPRGEQIVDVHGPVLARAVRGAPTVDEGLRTPSWAHLARVMAEADGFTGAAPWFYGWAVREAFVAGAEFQKTRGETS